MRNRITVHLPDGKRVHADPSEEFRTPTWPNGTFLTDAELGQYHESIDLRTEEIIEIAVAESNRRLGKVAA